MVSSSMVWYVFDNQLKLASGSSYDNKLPNKEFILFEKLKVFNVQLNE